MGRLVSEGGTRGKRPGGECPETGGPEVDRGRRAAGLTAFVLERNEVARCRDTSTKQSTLPVCLRHFECKCSHMADRRADQRFTARMARCCRRLQLKHTTAERRRVVLK